MDALALKFVADQQKRIDDLEDGYRTILAVLLNPGINVLASDCEYVSEIIRRIREIQGENKKN